jgi:septum site-determining protein MinC
MTTVRGRGRVLEITVDRPLAEAADELRAQFADRPDFYRGSRATANLGGLESDVSALAMFRTFLGNYGIVLDGIYGPATLGELALGLDLSYLGAPPVADVAPLPVRKNRAEKPVVLSDAALSLVADFAGARQDLAERRIQREAVRATVAAPSSVVIPPIPSAAPAGVSTLYHRGTLRGGQALHNLGNIVVIGDVNPGAELIASGDILVFGSMRGVAHAGAQGDAQARVIALELAPTQLRIATVIAADSGEPRKTSVPEQAYIDNGRIVVVPHAEASFPQREQAR